MPIPTTCRDYGHMEGLRELVLLDEMFAQCSLHVEVITASCQVRVVTVDSCHW